MPEQHLVIETSAADLMNGASLRVVLYPDTERDGQPDVESYNLNHILISGDRFWGSFGTLHHSVALTYVAKEANQDYEKINSSIPSAYAYSNHYTFVTMFSYLMNVTRFNDNRAYAKIRFVAINDSELVWDGVNMTAIDPIHAAVEEGRKLKLLFTDDEGFTAIHPVHTPEVYLNEKRACFYTAYDALPKPLWDDASLEKIDANLKNLREIKKQSPQEDLTYSSTPLIFNSQFNSTLYLVECRADGSFTASHWDIYERGFTEKSIKAVRVFAEK